MKSWLIVISCIGLFYSCSTEGVKKKRSDDIVIQKNNNEIKGNKPNKSGKISALNSDELAVKSTTSYDNGITISWMKRGKGDLIKKGDVIDIDYKVTLQDGKVIDGNHLKKMEFFSFVVGFQMQTKGWDYALEKLKVGDFVRVKIPAELARGEQGIKMEGEKGWFVPPNSVNYLTIRILRKLEPTRVVNGTKVWLIQENKDNKLKYNESNAITFHSLVSSESTPLYYNSYRNNTPYTMLGTDKGIIPGLKKALINAKKADRMFIVVPSEEAYGSKGLEGSVKPNEDLFYSVLVMDVVPK